MYSRAIPFGLISLPEIFNISLVNSLAPTTSYYFKHIAIWYYSACESHHVIQKTPTRSCFRHIEQSHKIFHLITFQYCIDLVNLVHLNENEKLKQYLHTGSFKSKIPAKRYLN